jgi:hypothetical protein
MFGSYYSRLHQRGGEQGRAENAEGDLGGAGRFGHGLMIALNGPGVKSLRIGFVQDGRTMARWRVAGWRVIRVRRVDRDRRDGPTALTMRVASIVPGPLPARRDLARPAFPYG